MALASANTDGLRTPRPERHLRLVPPLADTVPPVEVIRPAEVALLLGVTPPVEPAATVESTRSAKSARSAEPAATVESTRSVESAPPWVPADRPRLPIAPPRAQATPSRAPGARSSGPDARPAASRRRPVRLTRRGRVVVGALLLLATLGILALLAPPTEAALPSGPPRTVTVHQGDTLFSIASRAAPDAPPYAVMAAIQRLNHMSGTTVFVGQQLLLPPA